MNTTDVIIIGGGAAGIFAAINIGAKNPALNILILEKSNKLLSKVKVSGGGRCNVTHACFDPKELVKYYPRGEKELLGPFHQFQPGDTISWFAERGVELKIEDDGRMFPITDNSQTIIDCFTQELEKFKVEILYQASVEHVKQTENGFDVKTNNSSFVSKHLVIATGGFNKSDAYNFIAELGHHIIPPTPSLFTFNLPNNELLNLQGVVSNVEIKISKSNFIEQGPLLVTHWGVSGPAVLKLSSWAARYLNQKSYEFDFEVSWLPTHNTESLKVSLGKHKQDFGAKKIINQLDLELPKKLKKFLLNKAGIDDELKWAEINKEQINKLIDVLLNDKYHSKGKTTFKQEFVSCGGVKLSEVNFKTMESKLIPNLYFAGEVLDIDALTGGFNFQNAWTTAWILAQNIAE